MIKPRLVLDTNIYLSGIIFGGNCRHILDLMIGKKITVVISPGILLEISRKLTKKFQWSDKRAVMVATSIIKSAQLARPQLKLHAVPADKSDDKIIEAAVAGKAGYIISGDQHLLKLKKYRNIQIVSPQKFLAIYFKK